MADTNVDTIALLEELGLQLPPTNIFYSQEHNDQLTPSNNDFSEENSDQLTAPVYIDFSQEHNNDVEENEVVELINNGVQDTDTGYVEVEQSK